jgi:hypothetical protein
MKRVLSAFALCAALASAQVSNYSFTYFPNLYSPIVGTQVFGGGVDDSISGVIPLGFSFIFGSTAFTDVRICSNGWLAMGTTATTGTNYASISGTVPNIVAAFSRDLVTNATGNVQYLLQGTPGAQVFTVQWNDMRKYGAAAGSESFNFQVNLYEGSNYIEFVYGAMTTPVTAVNTVQVGLKGAATATDFESRQIISGVHTWQTSVAATLNTQNCGFNNVLFPANGDSFLFTPPPPFLAVTPTVNPATAVQSGTLVNIQAAITAVPTGYPTGVVSATIDLTNVGGVAGTPMTDLGGGIFDITFPAFGLGAAIVTINATDGVLVGSNTATVLIAPANDECVAAIPVAIGVNGPYSNAGATNSANAAATCGLGGNKNDVWFSFVATCPGAHTVLSGCGGFDSVVSIYNACGGAEVGCNDDNPNCGVGGSLATFTATVGNTYLIRVASYAQATTGNFSLTISAGGGFGLGFSAPLGAGSIQADITGGQPFGGYIFAVTFVPGLYPNGWLGGLDISFGDLLALVNAGFPFVGPLGACGEFTIGPFPGLPSGLTLYGSAIGTTTILGNVTGIAPAVSFTIP